MYELLLIVQTSGVVILFFIIGRIAAQKPKMDRRLIPLSIVLVIILILTTSDIPYFVLIACTAGYLVGRFRKGIPLRSLLTFAPSISIFYLVIVIYWFLERSAEVYDYPFIYSPSNLVGYLYLYPLLLVFFSFVFLIIFGFMKLIKRGSKELALVILSLLIVFAVKPFHPFGTIPLACCMLVGYWAGRYKVLWQRYYQNPFWFVVIVSCIFTLLYYFFLEDFLTYPEKHVYADYIVNKDWFLYSLFSGIIILSYGAVIGQLVRRIKERYKSTNREEKRLR